MVNTCVYIYIYIYIYTHTHTHTYIYIYIYVYVYTAAVIVGVGTVNGQMLWCLVWLANRVNDTIKTRVDTREITYCYLSMCIDAMYRNRLMYAEPQWGGYRSACKLLVEFVSYKMCLLPTETLLMFKNKLPNPTVYLQFATPIFMYCVYRVCAAGLRSYLKRGFPPVQTVPGAHPTSCKMGTGSFGGGGVNCGRVALLTTHPVLCFKVLIDRYIC